MAVYKSKCALGKVPVASLVSSLVSGIIYEYTTEANLAAGDIIVLGPIEANVRQVSCKLITDDLDSNGAPTITMSVGLLNAAGTDLDAGATSTFIAASTVGQAGGQVSSTTANTYLCGVGSTARANLCIKVVAGAATGVGAGKKIAVVLDCVE